MSNIDQVIAAWRRDQEVMTEVRAFMAWVAWCAMLAVACAWVV